MSVSKRKKPSANDVIKLYDEMSPKEQAKLRHAFLEDEEDIAIAEYRLKHPSKRISQKKLEKKLGMAD